MSWQKSMKFRAVGCGKLPKITGGKLAETAEVRL